MSYPSLKTIGISVLTGMIVLGACRYYKPVTLPDTTFKSTTFQQYIVDNKYFILRHPSGNYAMEDLRVNEKAQTLNCMLASLPAKHTLYVNSTHPNYRFVPSRGEDAVLREVHVYVKGGERPDTVSAYSIPLTDVQMIEVIDFDKGRTSTSYVLGAAIPVAAAVAIIAIASSKEEPPLQPPPNRQTSCPFISTFDGESYVVQGESYGGAIYPSLERRDYMPVQAAPVNGVYQLRISNELEEVQHTNEAKLLLVHHDKGVKALADENGTIYTVGATAAPARALLNDSKDVTASVAAGDGSFCSFNDTAGHDAVNSVVLHFARTTAAKEARLLLQVKNTFLLDGLYETFAQSFGGYYPQWVKSQQARSAERVQQMFRAQHIPLIVFIKTGDGWKKVRDLNTVGPLAFRDVVVPLDLSGVTGTETEIKLSTGFMFWDLNYAGIEYGPQAPFTVQTLLPFYARDEKDHDVLPSLLYNDQQYLNQPQPGNAAVLKFRCDRPVAQEATSVILETKGYYEHVRHYRGVPNLGLLKQLRQPGGFSALARHQYMEEYRRSGVVAARY